MVTDFKQIIPSAGNPSSFRGCNAIATGISNTGNAKFWFRIKGFKLCSIIIYDDFMIYYFQVAGICRFYTLGKFPCLSLGFPRYVNFLLYVYVLKLTVDVWFKNALSSTL